MPARDSRAPVRPAEPADLPAVAAIFAHYVATGVSTFEEVAPTAEQWCERLADLTGRGLPFLVTSIDGELAGFAYAGPWRPKPAYRHTVEDTIYLAPGHTGRGLGSPLLGALLDGCRRAAVRQVVAVIADPAAAASTALHRAHGFTEVGTLTGVGHKHGRWVDTLLMQRSL